MEGPAKRNQASAAERTKQDFRKQTQTQTHRHRHGHASLGPAMQEAQIGSLRGDDPLEKGMATESNILVWRIPRTEEPGGLQSIGWQKAGHG